MKKNNVPKLRFEGFTDDWQQRKWIEIVKRVNTSSSSKFHRRIEFEDINSGFGELIDKGKVQKRNTRKGILFQPKSILFGKLRPYLKNWIQPDFEGIAIGDFWVFEAQDTAPEFDYFLMQSSAFQKVANDTSGTKMPRSDWKVVSTTKFQIPLDFSEQQKIGQLFQTLDSRIIQQKKQIELFKRLKKGYLQKIFNQEVRFSGFTQDWKVKELKELGKTQSGIAFPDEEQGRESGTPFFKISDMNLIGNENELLNSNNYVNDEQIQRKKWKPITKFPAIVFAKVGAAIMLNRKRLVRTPFLIDNNIMAYIFDDSWDASFGKTLFDTINLSRFIQIGALPSYKSSDIESIKVNVPSSEEQKIIGFFFQTLDTKISLAEEKLSALNQLKKVFLQKMFI